MSAGDRHDRPAAVAAEAAPDDLSWHAPSVAPLELSGFPWYAEDGVYRRLPVTPPEPLPEAVDRLADHTSGGQIRWRSDSRRVAVRVELAGRASMNHMPATGQCGFDLYVGAPGQERFAAVTKYDHAQTHYEAVLLHQPEAEWRDLTLFFPLYQGVRSVDVGLVTGAAIEVPAPRARVAPLVFYGTSITQGGCAARPGMSFTAILSRRLQAECVNLGFSGNGRGEPEVARAMALIPASSLYVLDYDANCPDAAHLSRTLPVFIGILRQRHPVTPILVVSRIPTASEGWNASARQVREARAGAQRQVVDDLRSGGDGRLAFVDGGALLGEDFDETTVDGSHPTDLGFLRMADALEPTIRGLLP